MFDRLTSAAVSVVLAFLVWLYARSRDQEVMDNVPVPVRVQLPPGDAGQFLLEVAGNGSVPASFTGPPSRMRELRESLRRGELGVSVTLAVPADWRGESRIHDSVRVGAAELHPPPRVRAAVVEGQNRVP